MSAGPVDDSNWLTTRRESGRLRPNNARQGYVDLRIDTLKLAGYLFGRPA